jgi:hypothetical protein
MIRNNVEKVQSFTKSLEEVQPQGKHKPLFELVMIVCSLAFVTCFLVMVAPLSRLPGTSVTSQMPLRKLVASAGFWLPRDLHLDSNLQNSRWGTNTIEFMLLIAVAFVIYGLCALFISYWAPENKYNRTLLMIWLSTLAAGLLLLLVSASVSHDVFVYAGYGRLMVVYHANPYFVPPATFPHDPIYPLNGWTYSTSAYGPLWLLVCALSELFCGADPLRYVIFFCVLGLILHLLNTLLVMNILRTMGRSQRTVVLGTMLYAWNPLVLFESSNGGHNDIFMITFILLGILFAVRAEKRGFGHLRNYVLPVVAFTLAALVKFTAAPLIVLFIITLIIYQLRLASSPSGSFRESLHYRGEPALRAALSASIISGVVVLLFYGPFFIGHSVHAIIASFTSPPSSTGAHKSLLDGVLQWKSRLHLPPHTFTHALIYQLSNHKLWTAITIVTLAGTMIVGIVWLWKTPTVRTFVLASLATLGAFLVVAPWFLTWYTSWPVALAVVCLPVMYERKGRALLAFALVFSATAFFLYLYNGSPPGKGWNLFSCLITYAPPLLAFIIFLVLPRANKVRKYSTA